MISVLECKKAAVYHNTDKLTLAQIKAKTGCTHIINGYLFNKRFDPCGWLVIDGKVISKDKYNDWGFACNKTGAPTMSTDRTNNFLGAIPIIRNKARLYRNLTPDVARPAERSAIAWFPNGRIILWCDEEKLTRDELQTKLLAIGASDAVMLDGGGSTQCIFPEGEVRSSRIVATAVLFWDKDSKDEPAQPIQNSRCPYMEPTRLIKRGSIGAGSKWVQWQLNRHGASLDVDGDFGKLSVEALTAFQKKSGLDADGICGPATIAALKL